MKFRHFGAIFTFPGPKTVAKTISGSGFDYLIFSTFEPGFPLVSALLEIYVSALRHFPLQLSLYKPF